MLNLYAFSAFSHLSVFMNSYSYLKSFSALEPVHQSSVMLDSEMRDGELHNVEIVKNHIQVCRITVFSIP